MNKSQMLRNLARRNGLCDKWFSEWGDEESDQSMIDKYVKGFDFCIQHDYPPLPTIKRAFSQKVLHDNNIYTDGYFRALNPKHHLIALGDTDLVVRCDEFLVTTIYARHDSNITLEVRDNAIVDVRLYDNATVKVKHLDTKSRLNIFVRSDNAELDLNTYATSDNLKIYPYKHD